MEQRLTECVGIESNNNMILVKKNIVKSVGIKKKQFFVYSNDTIEKQKGGFKFWGHNLYSHARHRDKNKSV